MKILKVAHADMSRWATDVTCMGQGFGAAGGGCMTELRVELPDLFFSTPEGPHSTPVISFQCPVCLTISDLSGVPDRMRYHCEAAAHRNQTGSADAYARIATRVQQQLAAEPSTP